MKNHVRIFNDIIAEVITLLGVITFWIELHANFLYFQALLHFQEIISLSDAVYQMAER